MAKTGAMLGGFIKPWEGHNEIKAKGTDKNGLVMLRSG